MQYTGQVTPIPLNVDRCVDLHNAIIRESSHVPGHPDLRVAKYIDHWATSDIYQSEQLAERLSGPILNFLSRSDIIPESVQDMTPFTPGLAHPSQIYPEADPLFYGDYNDCIKLYPSNNIEDDCIGLVFDMDTNKATWIDQPLDGPPEYTEHVWLPLDEVLEAWLYYIRRKRCIPRGHEHMSPTRGEMAGWDMVYPPIQDVDDAVATWNEYVSLVESKLPDTGRRAQADAEGNPDLSQLAGFPGAFFSRARRPSFSQIAPGLVFPVSSQMSLLARRYQEHLRTENVSPTTGKDSDGKTRVVATVIFPLGDNIHAGLCTMCDAGRQDGVGLVLPSSEGYDFWSSGPVSRTANCPPRFEKVWQPVPNESPYGPVSPARLATVLRKWIDLVREGTWSIGPDGVQGTLDEFVRLEEYVGYEVEFRPVGMLLDVVDM